MTFQILNTPVDFKLKTCRLDKDTVKENDIITKKVNLQNTYGSRYPNTFIHLFERNRLAVFKYPWQNTWIKLGIPAWIHKCAWPCHQTET